MHSASASVWPQCYLTIALDAEYTAAQLILYNKYEKKKKNAPLMFAHRVGQCCCGALLSIGSKPPCFAHPRMSSCICAFKYISMEHWRTTDHFCMDEGETPNIPLQTYVHTQKRSELNSNDIIKFESNEIQVLLTDCYWVGWKKI